MRLCKKIFFCLSLLLVSSSVFATQKFIIDTDMNSDDAIAILYMLENKNSEVKAISISGAGLAHCKQALVNLSALLKLAGKTIPYGCGRSTPLAGSHHFPNAARREADSLMDTARFLPRTNVVQKSTAFAVLKKVLSDNDHLTLLALAPLTNIAEVLKANPQLKQNIEKILIMGGAVHVPGNVRQLDPRQKNDVAEWNMYIDPTAANWVFHSKIPLVLIPLDITNTQVMEKSFFEHLSEPPKTKSAQYVVLFFKHNENTLLKQHWCFWDPIAAFVALDYSHLQLTLHSIRIQVSPETLAGQTSLETLGDKNTQLVISLSQKQFLKNMMSFLDQKLTP